MADTSSRRTLHTPERLVRQSLRAWLDLHKIPHIPVEPIRPFVKDGTIRFRTEQPRDKGCADFIAFVPACGFNAYGAQIAEPVHIIPIAIEAKSSRGKQSAAQQEWERWWTGQGFTYILVRSVDDLKKAWPVML